MKGPLERGIFSFTGHIIKSKFYRSSYMFWDTSLLCSPAVAHARAALFQSRTENLEGEKNVHGLLLKNLLP